MLSFLTAHVKHILTVAFGCGLISIGLRFLDEKLSDDSKRKFGIWVSNLAPRLDSLSLDGLYTWAKYNKRTFVFSYSITIILAVLCIGTPSRISHWTWISSPTGEGYYFNACWGIHLTAQRS